MRAIIIVILLMLANVISAASFNTLEDFNHLAPRDEAFMAYGGDPELIAQFQTKAFVCQDVVDRSPTEGEAAARTFKAFVEYTIQGSEVEKFWDDDDHKQKRKDLLKAALETGSWKAEYLDTLWALRDARGPKNKEAANEALTRLRKLVEKGVPIAGYKYANRLFPYSNKNMYYLYDVAIDRGNPQAMTEVGAAIILRSKELRPLAKDLLECALSLGHEKSYEWLGKLASIEGRELDAYRLWEKGVNEGCEQCINYVDRIATVRAKAGRPGYLDPSPDLEAIKEFYGFPFRNVFYELTELPEFKRSLPTEKYFQPDDSEVLSLLKLEKNLREQ